MPNVPNDARTRVDTAKIDPEKLKEWTTAALVIYLASYVMGGMKPERREQALMVGHELNVRIPPRVMPPGYKEST